ncbi:phosphate acetyltransferase [Psychrobacillus glaciei]|uniref:Phosphate acetyltransferase n=1 Tax=Psychrobacillus glaciei TaxID=2283160 RepID=A0A5J6SKC4_9BACI|nr:phosphate acetyltransferase [Psychrobacillus glaciei]QFF97883.1 phosphate acetyltransferase [Psychrobacillus glaciei]
MADLFHEIKHKLSGANISVVLPEGTDERVLDAAVKLQAEGIIQPIVISSSKKLPKNLTVIDPEAYEEMDDLVSAFVERRKGKITEIEARALLKDVNYFGTMLVYTGRANGLVSGAAHTTAETVRPALQIIKTKPGITKTSGAFIMVKDKLRYIFADCAITIAPTSEDLAEIAVESAKTATAFGIKPKVAMLSFSTKGSAQSEETEKVVKATKIAKVLAPNIAIEGELQFDASIVPAIAAKKAPDAVVQGDANVFVFPSLEAGNIGYKIAERLGGFEAIGPILQGLNAPVNDLSRGCSAEDVYKLAYITAAQALE